MTWKQVPIDDYDATIKPALANGEGVDCFEVSAGSANGGVSIFGPMAVDMTPALIDVLGEDYADKISESSLTTMTVDGEIKALGVGTVYAGNLWNFSDNFWFEIIQPLGDNDPWAQWLKDHGTSICSVCLLSDGPLEEDEKKMDSCGYPSLFKQEKGYEAYEYFDTAGDLGVLVEVKEHY